MTVSPSAAKVSAYWYSFAISAGGDPNPTSGAHAVWPRHTAETDTVLRMEAEGAGGIRAQVWGSRPGWPQLYGAGQSGVRNGCFL